MYLPYLFYYIFFQLGVNGYSFIVNNNGHVLYHPDLRPMVSINSNISNKINKMLITIKSKYWDIYVNDILFQ